MLTGAIRAAFGRANHEGRAAFIPYLMAGYPDIPTSVALGKALAGAGADVIELGVPFSDPLADGATIQHASQIALERGMNLLKCFDVAQAIAEATHVPLALMGYYNPFLRLGLDEVCAIAAESGVSGLIIPDLPAEEAQPLIAAAQPHGISPIFLVTPTSPEPRLAQIAQVAQAAKSGFLYGVSLSGVTGARSALAQDLPDFVARIKRYATDIPLAIGFGIAQPEHTAAVAKLAEGVVVASALLNAFDAAPQGQGVAAVESLARRLRDAAQRPVKT